jgi:hypothetical protein
MLANSYQQQYAFALAPAHNAKIQKLGLKCFEFAQNNDKITNKDIFYEFKRRKQRVR